MMAAKLLRHSDSISVFLFSSAFPYFHEAHVRKGSMAIRHVIPVLIV
jgi:hypothetical protein